MLPIMASVEGGYVLFDNDDIVPIYALVDENEIPTEDAERAYGMICFHEGAMYVLGIKQLQPTIH